MHNQRWIHPALLFCLMFTGCAQPSNSRQIGADQGRERSASQQVPTKAAPQGNLAAADSALYFIDKERGWVLQDGDLYGTINGGGSWVKLNHGKLNNFRSVVFTTEQSGWAICDEWATARRSNSVFQTNDGGRTWSRSLELPTPIYSVNFLDPQVGYVGGRWQPIKHTVDGGKTWSDSDSTEGLNYVYFLDQKTGWGYGGAIWHTSDGGATWEQDVSYELVDDLWQADFVDASTGWIIGKRQVWHTVDGTSWKKATNLPDAKSDFSSVDFIDRDEGWITSADGLILHTSDGGNSWQTLATLSAGGNALRFLNKQEGWMIDSKDHLMRTNDGGKNWSVSPLNKSS